MPKAESTKVCPKCHVEKPLDAFWKTHYSCKVCCRVYRSTEKYKAEQCQSVMKYHKTEKGRLVKNRLNKKYYQTQKGKDSKNRGSAKYRKTPLGIIKIKAKTAVLIAVRAGRIPAANSLKCTECGEQAQHYHHHLGYEKEHWFSVVPVCIKCHFKIHATELVTQ